MLKPIIAIVVALILSMLIAIAGSNNSALFDGMPIFMLCASVGFVLHWLGFIPAYLFQTEHYFDLIGSISYVATTSAGHPRRDIPPEGTRFTESMAP